MTSVEFRKDLFADERDDDLNEIGKPTRRQDILGHVTGRTKFYDDHLFDGLLHMRAVRCPHHHARIRSMDLSAVEAAPGVVRVLTGKDVPVNLNTLLSLMDFGKDDEEVLSTSICRYRGEAVAAVVAESEAAARAAVALARIDWEPLPHVLDVYEALEPGAPSVNPAYPGNAFEYHEKYDHQKLRFGDFDRALQGAAHVVEGTYGISPIEQAPIETCGAIAAPETNDRYVCHTSTQGLFFSLGTSAKLLDTSSARLHFIGGTVGGGFGGKVDSMHEPLALLAAMKTGRPVKYMWDREEEMQVGAPRGGERWEITDAVAADGRILGRRLRGFFDSGAYTRLSSYGVVKSVGHLPGPYTIPNVSADVYCVYTNRTPSTAMRGFGITGVDFSIEVHMDRVAETVGLDPIELRILNAYRDGDMKAHRRVAKNCALVESCQVAAGKAHWSISAEAQAASSMIGGGEGWRAEIPPTVTDGAGALAAGYAASVGTGGGEASRPPTPASPPPVPYPTLGAGRPPRGARRPARIALQLRAIVLRLRVRRGRTLRLVALRRDAFAPLRCPAELRLAPRLRVVARRPARLRQGAPRSAARRGRPAGHGRNARRAAPSIDARALSRALHPRRQTPGRPSLLRHQEALSMALHRGRGFACINYPIGMNLGGDPSQALVHSNPDGKFTVALSSIDLGQGMKSVTRQIAAETLGIPVEDVYVDTADSDTGPHCMGSFASRGTHRVGNAVIAAATEARGVLLEAAAEEMEVDPGDLDTDGAGNIHVKGAPHRSITVQEASNAAQFKQGRTVSGRGIFLIPLSDVDPDTGEMTPVSCFAHAALIADVEVDDETGEVGVLEINSAYEVGRALNPKLVEQQLIGGAWMGLSHALYETTEPNYPDRAHGAVDFNHYLMPGPGQIAPHHIAILERPAPDGPYGGKGPGEMCANPVLPAVANAVYDAIGVRVNFLPITPEKVLRALRENGGARPGGTSRGEPAPNGGRAALAGATSADGRR